MSGPPHSAPYLVQLSDAQTAVARELFGSLPPRGWRSCTVEYLAVASMAESKVSITDDDGVSTVIKSPIAMILTLRNLRELMAGQGQGAWLSATVTADPSGRCTFDYNYRTRPNWTVPPADQTYIDDLKAHPRPADQIPDWYPRT